MEPSPKPPRRSRRWLQFSLSNLLLVTLLVAVVVAWQRERISHWVESLWGETDHQARRPPSFTIQVAIGELTLDSADSSSVEEALQDAIAGASELPSTPTTTTSPLSFGGMVLSASNEVAIALVRSLKQCRRFVVLSRPQITTLANQPAYVQVGQQIQLIPSAVDPTTPSQPNPASAILSAS